MTAAGKAGGKGKAGGTQVSIAIDEEWVAAHAEQLQRMLPGGEQRRLHNPLPPLPPGVHALLHPLEATPGQRARTHAVLMRMPCARLQA